MIQILKILLISEELESFWPQYQAYKQLCHHFCLESTGLYPFHPERNLESSLVSNDLSDEKYILLGNKKRKMTWFQEGDSEKGEVVRVNIFPEKSYPTEAD